MTPLDIIEKALRAKVDKVKRRDNSITAQCPAHDDSSPSLSVAVGKTRDIVITCHAGCAADDVMAALDLRWTDLSDGTNLTEVAVYPYTDEHGTVLFEVVRYQPKTFRQRRPGNRWGLGDTRRPLYRLPKVLAAAAAGDTIYIPEGEKDVEAIESAGAVATCPPASNWEKVPDAADSVRGGDVVIVADRDTAGYSKALQIGADLLLHDVPHRYALAAVGKDVSDHLAAGKTLDELEPVDVVGLQTLLHGTNDWPTPRALYAGLNGDGLPTFPLEALPDWVADLIRDLAEGLQVAIDMPAMVVLGAVSTVCSGRIAVKLKGSSWVEDVNIYLVIGAPPGTGKSPVFKIIIRPVKAWEERLRTQARSVIAEADSKKTILEKKLRRYQDAAAKADPDDMAPACEAAKVKEQLMTHEVPCEPRLFADDATPEVLVRLMASQGGRLAILSSEGGVFDVIAGAYSGNGTKTNLDVYVKGHSGDEIRRDRIRDNEQVSIDKALLTICVTTQNGVIEAMGADADAVRRGLPVRFMFSVPPSNIGYRDRSAIYDEDSDSTAIATWHDRLLEIAETLPSTKKVLGTTEEARAAYEAWDKQLEMRLRPTGDLVEMAEWTQKLRSTVLRVCGLLHVLEGGNGEIGVDTMRRALVIADYWTAHAAAVHMAWGTRHGKDVAYRLLRSVAKKEARTFTPRELLRLNSRLVDSVSDLTDPVEMLCEAGWATTDGGEPSDFGSHRQGVVVRFRPDLTPEMLDGMQGKSQSVAHVALSPRGVYHTPSPSSFSTHTHTPPARQRDMRDNPENTSPPPNTTEGEKTHPLAGFFHTP